MRSPQLLAAWEGFCSPQLALGCTHLYRDTPLGVALGPGNVQLGRAPSRDVSQPRRGTALVPSRSATGLGTRPSPTAQAPAPISAPSVCQQIARAVNVPPSRPYRTLPLCSISEKPHSSSQQWPCCFSAAVDPRATWARQAQAWHSTAARSWDEARRGPCPAWPRATRLPAAIKPVGPETRPCPPRMAFLWAVACLALASAVSGKHSHAPSGVAPCPPSAPPSTAPEVPAGPGGQ